MVGQTGELLGHNMFAYTKDNPISISDLSGYRTVRADYESLEQFGGIERGKNIN